MIALTLGKMLVSLTPVGVGLSIVLQIIIAIGQAVIGVKAVTESLLKVITSKLLSILF